MGGPTGDSARPSARRRQRPGMTHDPATMKSFRLRAATSVIPGRRGCGERGIQTAHTPYRRLESGFAQERAPE
jgi:hypothetical protein